VRYVGLTRSVRFSMLCQNIHSGSASATFIEFIEYIYCLSMYVETLDFDEYSERLILTEARKCNRLFILETKSG
jgi:hypothetical protein